MKLEMDTGFEIALKHSTLTIGPSGPCGEGVNKWPECSKFADICGSGTTADISSFDHEFSGLTCRTSSVGELEIWSLTDWNQSFIYCTDVLVVLDQL